jgi:hypothetical protein
METALTQDPANWRVAVRWKLTWLLLAKLGLLTLLWAFCFSPSHRKPVDAATAGRHIVPEETARE